jgi:hypothetical protein
MSLTLQQQTRTQVIRYHVAGNLLNQPLRAQHQECAIWCEIVPRKPMPPPGDRELVEEE